MMKSNFLAFCLFALSPNNLKTKKSFVIRSGFEPETHSLEGCCSIQLSYQTSSECACKKKLATRVWLAAIPPLNSGSRSPRYFLRLYT